MWHNRHKYIHKIVNTDHGEQLASLYGQSKKLNFKFHIKKYIKFYIHKILPRFLIWASIKKHWLEYVTPSEPQMGEYMRGQNCAFDSVNKTKANKKKNAKNVVGFIVRRLQIFLQNYCKTCQRFFDVWYWKGFSSWIFMWFWGLNICWIVCKSFLDFQLSALNSISTMVPFK